MKLVIGLGNPNIDPSTALRTGYEKTRHNLGKRVVDFAHGELGSRYNLPVWEKKEKLFSEIAAGRNALVLAKPLVYMNESGKTAGALAKFYKVKPDNVLIAHDDSDIFFGKMKLSYGSRSAGHRGVESVIRALKTKNFWRLRVGIRPPNEEIRKKADELILEPFTGPEERKLKEEIFPKSVELLKAWLTK